MCADFLVRCQRARDVRDETLDPELSLLLRTVEPPERLGGDAHARILKRLRNFDTRGWVPPRIVPRRVLIAIAVLSTGLFGLGAAAGILWMQATHPSPRLSQSGVGEGDVASFVSNLARAIPNPQPAPTEMPREGVGGESAGLPQPLVTPIASVRPGEPKEAVIRVRPPRERPHWRGASTARSHLAETNSKTPVSVTGVPTAAATDALTAESPSSAPAPPTRAASTLTREWSLLEAALTEIKHHNYAAGLAGLARYDAEFPDGNLRTEAMLARLHAWKHSGHTGEALGYLDRTAISGPRATDLLALRGELRASAGRCEEAIGDLDLAISQSASGATEAVLHARAACRIRTGDTHGAIEDAGEYLKRFPDGPHANEAMKLVRP